MNIVKHSKELQQILSNLRKNKKIIGFIPTMGGIHKGHLSLVKQSREMNYTTVVSIYVNPTQFNDKKDFESYPQNSIEDIKKLNQSDCDILFFPKTSDLYPDGLKKNKLIFDYRDILCDKFRPGHFDGVTTVVNSLFDLIKPNFAFFGEKDFQQLKIIQKLSLTNNFQTIIKSCPSVRLPNGMSYSSRYYNFSFDQKKIFNKIALEIKKHLNFIKENNNQNTLNNLNNSILLAGANKIEYLEIREENNLNISEKNKNSRLFIAFYIDTIRVIDNFILY
ncbi:MAG: pantoate--beta-alanine ligase [Rickettsiales bacterium]|nr:pantoate--beta-alanine ligase [Rickettsiales bacterium]|tara:strand:+ start:764 stop:1597 length:834 start_codon:yes stop_codon:yes gene_type:complete